MEFHIFKVLELYTNKVLDFAGKKVDKILCRQHKKRPLSNVCVENCQVDDPEVSGSVLLNTWFCRIKEIENAPRLISYEMDLIHTLQFCLKQGEREWTSFFYHGPNPLFLGKQLDDKLRFSHSQIVNADAKG